MQVVIAAVVDGGIVTDNVVAAVGIVFSQMNIAVHLIVHPVLGVRRDVRGNVVSVSADRRDITPESWQLVEIDRPRGGRRRVRRLPPRLRGLRRAGGLGVSVGSSQAFSPRVMIALMENNQLPDGRIAVPALPMSRTERGRPRPSSSLTARTVSWSMVSSPAV